MGNPEASMERMIREVMHVDKVHEMAPLWIQ